MIVFRGESESGRINRQKRSRRQIARGKSVFGSECVGGSDHQASESNQRGSMIVKLDLKVGIQGRRHFVEGKVRQSRECILRAGGAIDLAAGRSSFPDAPFRCGDRVLRG